MTSTSSSPYSQSSETFANHATSTAFIPPHDRTQSGPTQPCAYALLLVHSTSVGSVRPCPVPRTPSAPRLTDPFPFLCPCPAIAELHAEIEDLLKANAAESQAVHRRCAAMIAWADRGMNRADKPSEDLKDYYVRE